MSPVEIMFFIYIKMHRMLTLNVAVRFSEDFYACLALETVENRRFSAFRGSGIQRIFSMNIYGENTGFLKWPGFQRIPVFRGSGFQSF
jgi:hypothetical protein